MTTRLDIVLLIFLTSCVFSSSAFY